ncbi:hypothetical protein KIL84_006389 [Mauremys mutica]|uniref:Uncharacterized protein n=1 Tax=Mauremys mutica TaxID=74926 RepID=A0A9D3X0V3_9SAUR|nr:hypothetical protein KIL84_006389 [Mauremys mutica]
MTTCKQASQIQNQPIELPSGTELRMGGSVCVTNPRSPDLLTGCDSASVIGSLCQNTCFSALWSKRIGSSNSTHNPLHLPVFTAPVLKRDVQQKTNQPQH